MDIGPVNASDSQPVNDRRGSSEDPPPGGKGEPKPTDTDSVEISLAARSRLAQLADEIRRTERSQAQTPEDRTDRIERARSRIASGFYDQPEIKQRIAEKMMEDVTKPPDNREDEGKQ